MSRVYFRNELEGVATWWRIARKDGVTLGFTSHDRDLWFDGLLHRSAPGMLPSAIRRTADLTADSAEVRGTLAHDSLSSEDLAAGRFDGAHIRVGLVDWETLERASLYHGEIGALSEEANGFGAELRSAKTALETDLVPRTSPTCRAIFCGPGCNLNPVSFTHEAVVASVDLEENRVRFTGGPSPAAMESGSLRWLDSPLAGTKTEVIEADNTGLLLEAPLDPAIEAGTRAILREGCDHTLATCASRFGNAVNFRGEPFLPGNDLLARYPVSTR